MERPPGDRICLYDTDTLEIVLDRMARDIAARFADRPKLALVGMLRRGAPLADRLHQRLVAHHGFELPLRLDLAVKRYADDLTLLYPETRLSEGSGEMARKLAGTTLLVVDDVLYTGHSAMRVVTHLMHRQPVEIGLAVLVDRGATRLPIRADVVGVHLEVAPDDIVECNVPPYEPAFRIELLKPARAPDARGAEAGGLDDVR